MIDMRRVGHGALPTWSFHLEEVPPGKYQAELLPFLATWIVEVPAGGRDDVELTLPELAEVRLDIVDKETGVRVPIEQLHFRATERPAGLLFNNWQKVDAERIYPLEAFEKAGKRSVLKALADEFPDAQLHFFEDRFVTLDKIRDMTDLNLYLVDWGYNTEKERRRAHEDPQIEVLERQSFEALLANADN